MGFEKCIEPCTDHHKHTEQSNPIVTSKSPPADSVINPPPRLLADVFSAPVVSPFSGTSWKQNHTILRLLALVSFTDKMHLRFIHVVRIKTFPFYCCAMFHPFCRCPIVCFFIYWLKGILVVSSLGQL